MKYPKWFSYGLKAKLNAFDSGEFSERDLVWSFNNYSWLGA